LGSWRKNMPRLQREGDALAHLRAGNRSFTADPAEPNVYMVHKEAI